jgi:hypothetical protein
LRAFHGRDRIRYVMKETKLPKDLIHMRQGGLFLRRTFAIRGGIDINSGYNDIEDTALPCPYN